MVGDEADIVNKSGRGLTLSNKDGWKVSRQMAGVMLTVRMWGAAGVQSVLLTPGGLRH
jgi:hypothetical protein